MKATTRFIRLVAASMTLAMTGAAHAQGNPLTAIQSQVTGVQATLDAMKPKVDALGPKVDALGPKLDLVNGKLDAQATTAAANVQALQASLTALSLKIDALATPAGMVPFSVQAPGGLCDSGPSPSSNPQILIEGTGSHLFVVNSILVKSAPQPAGQEGYAFFTVNSVTIDGTGFDTRTGNLMATVDGFGVQESADLMGTPVRIEPPVGLTSTPRSASESGGNFPHQIVADAAGSGDIRIQLFCRSDAFPFSVETVRVSGWKWATDSVAVSYLPGN